jgi:hypothetical protein
MQARSAPHAVLAARFLAAGVLLGGLSVPALARAQTVSQSPGQPYPVRLIKNVVQNVRPENLNPQGINYADCASDMVLQYNVLISGFTNQTVEVWVSTSGNCTMDSNRGNNGVANCWLVARSQPQRATTSAPLQFTVPVRAIVGPQSQTTFPAGLVGDTGIEACSAQATSSAVQFTVFILPIQSPATYVGQGFMQTITADTVGPQTPLINAPSVGDTFINASWTANADPDTVGYDVFFEQAGTSTNTSTVVCKEAGTSTTQQDSGEDAADGAQGPTDAATASDADDGAAFSTDATATSDADDGAVSTIDATTADGATDAATAADSLDEPSPCITVGPTTTSSCGSSSALSASIVSDSGTSSSNNTTSVGEDGAIVVEDAGAISAGPGGIATIDCKFLIGGNNCPAGQPAYVSTAITLSGQANNSFNITGLTDGVSYNYTVAAVDGFGNPGPPANVQCGTPAKVNDFFTLYRSDGGRAGGGFCALDVVGERSETSLGLVGLGLGAALYARRKRSRRS